MVIIIITQYILFEKVRTSDQSLIINYLQKCHYEMNDAVQWSWNVNLPICILNSVNHEVFEPINISFIPSVKRKHRLMAIVSSYSVTGKKKLHCAGKGLHLMSFYVSLHPFLQHRKELISKEHILKFKPTHRINVKMLYLKEKTK